MKRLANSPVKIIGLLTILLGLTVSVMTFGYLIVLGLICIGVGLLVFLVDYSIGKFTKTDREYSTCLLYTSPSPRDKRQSRMPSSA